MGNSRSKNASLNIVIGFMVQTGILLLSFVGRRIFVQFLSAEYLGINGLYSNILSVLSLAELGLGHVIQFFLYKPVTERNEAMIVTLMQYFKKLYRAIATGVLIIGVSLIPLLKFIVNSNLPQDKLIIYYILFLLNSVVSYFSAHNHALLAANQDNRLSKIVNLATTFTLQVIHIVVLLIWHNYTVYVFATFISTIVNVTTVNLICTKRYSYLKLRISNKRENINKNFIFTNIKATFVYKMGAIIVNNTDNILISMMISTAAVGLYSNYYLVVGALQSFITIMTMALISGIGNLSAERNKARMLSIFNTMLLPYHFIAAYGGISFFLLFNDLIPIWLGQDYLLDLGTVFAIAFNFYLTNAISPIWMFREANGLFVKVKYLFLITAACNIVFSILLGNIFGIFGILIATSIARIVTQVWYEPFILFNNTFTKSTKSYWEKQLKYMLLSVFSALICYMLSQFLPHDFIFIVIKAILYFVICIIIFGVAVLHSEEMSELLNFGKNLFVRH